jgi:four helix bundle protein
MGRLQPEFLERVEGFADRVLNVVEALARQRRSIRILDQLTGSGTAVGANLFEADEALSRRDFRKCLAIANKELSETLFWLRLITRRGWLDRPRVEDLLDEAQQIKRIVGSILTKTREPAPTA